MFQKIDHINISVKNLIESVAWYEKVFGFKTVEQGRSQAGAKYVIVENHDFMLCMYEHPEWKAPNFEINTNKHQIFHVGFRITDELKWKELIRTLNLTLAYDEISYPRSKSWYVLDPNGYEIEVSCLKEGVAMFAD